MKRRVVTITPVEKPKSRTRRSKTFTLTPRGVPRGEAFLHHGLPYVRLKDDSERVFDVNLCTVCSIDDFPADDKVELLHLNLSFKTVKEV